MIVNQLQIEEADFGKRRGILVSAKIDSVDPPLGFGLIQAADLTDWKAESTHSGLTILLRAISEIVRPPPINVKEEEQKRKFYAEQKDKEETAFRPIRQIMTATIQERIAPKENIEISRLGLEVSKPTLESGVKA